jgi:hypothetical protein
MAHTHRKRRIALLLLTLWPVFHVGVQPVAAEPSAAERDTARTLMAEGDRLRTAGDLRGALTRYQAAHAIVHVPTTGLDLARLQSQLGLLVEARSTLTEVVHTPVAANEPKVFAECRSQALTLLNELETRVPAIKTDVLPPAAAYTLSVDGVTLPTEIRGLPYRVNPGPHSVRVDAPGFQPEYRQLTLADGETRSVSVTLAPQPTAAAPAVTHDAQQAQLAVSPSRLAEDEARRERVSAARTRGVIGLSVGGAALVLGTVTGIMSLSSASGLKEACEDNTCPQSQRGELSTANTLANVANISLPLGLIGVGYGLFELLTLPSAPASSEHASALRVEFTGLGANVRGDL